MQTPKLRPYWNAPITVKQGQVRILSSLEQRVFAGVVAAVDGHGGPVALKDIAALVPGSAYSSVATTLQRLVKKGLLRMVKTTPPQYAPVVDDHDATVIREVLMSLIATYDSDSIIATLDALCLTTPQR